MLTVQQLKSTDVINKGAYVGYQSGSFIATFMQGMISVKNYFRHYGSFEEYDDALFKGDRNGGVSAIVDEMPYARLFLSKYCHKYTMIDQTYYKGSSGFGFVFRKGSPLVSDVSTEILKLKEDGKMERIVQTWFGPEGCSSADGVESLNLDRFRGLFLIAGLSSSTALAIFLSKFLYENQHLLASSASVKQKLHDLARAFVQEKDDISKHSETPGEIVLTQSLSIRTLCDQDGTFSQDEELSTTEIETQEASS